MKVNVHWPKLLTATFSAPAIVIIAQLLVQSYVLPALIASIMLFVLIRSGLIEVFPNMNSLARFVLFLFPVRCLIAYLVGSIELSNWLDYLLLAAEVLLQIVFYFSIRESKLGS